MTNKQDHNPTGEVRPRRTLGPSDYERLSMLVRAAANTMPDVASSLADELDRAHVLADSHPAQTVHMGGEVEFRDESTGRIQTVTLVYPEEADITNKRVSVLTPIGTALIGLHAGDSITWETRVGNLRALTVLRVCEPQFT